MSEEGRIVLAVVAMVLSVVSIALGCWGMWLCHKAKRKITHPRK